MRDEGYYCSCLMMYFICLCTGTCVFISLLMIYILNNFFFIISIAALRNSKSAVVNMGVKAGIYITQVRNVTLNLLISIVSVKLVISIISSALFIIKSWLLLPGNFVIMTIEWDCWTLIKYTKQYWFIIVYYSIDIYK